MGRGYHKEHCATCQKETWHYTSELGQVICCYHTNNLINGAATREVKSQPIRVAGRLDRSLWRHAEQQSKTAVDLGEYQWAQDLFEPSPVVTPLDPDKVYCSFCGKETQQITLTSEKRPVIKVMRDAYKDASGDVHITEKVTSRSETYHACPNCCLQIRKPIIAHTV